jgi:hypothetical protein
MGSPRRNPKGLARAGQGSGVQTFGVLGQGSGVQTFGVVGQGSGGQTFGVL